MGVGDFANSVSTGIDKGLDGAAGMMDKGLLKADIKAMQQKKASQISELEVEHGKILQSLGRRLYDCRGDISAEKEQYEEDFQKLDMLEARLRQLRGTLQILKSSMAPAYMAASNENLRCPSCNGLITIMDVACSSCGRDIDTMAEMFKACPSCGRVYDANAGFCEECGVKLVGADMKSIANRRSKLSQDMSPAEPVRCPRCGRLAKRGENFCMGCGSKLS